MRGEFFRVGDGFLRLRGEFFRVGDGFFRVGDGFLRVGQSSLHKVAVDDCLGRQSSELMGYV